MTYSWFSHHKSSISHRYPAIPKLGVYSLLGINFFLLQTSSSGAGIRNRSPPSSERPSQRARVASRGIWTGPSGSGVVIGSVAHMPNLLTHYWAPPGTITCQYLTLDDNFSPQFLPSTTTHVRHYDFIFFLLFLFVPTD